MKNGRHDRFPPGAATVLILTLAFAAAWFWAVCRVVG